MMSSPLVNYIVRRRVAKRAEDANLTDGLEQYSGQMKQAPLPAGTARSGWTTPGGGIAESPFYKEALKALRLDPSLGAGIGPLLRNRPLASRRRLSPLPPQQAQPDLLQKPYVIPKSPSPLPQLDPNKISPTLPQFDANEMLQKLRQKNSRKQQNLANALRT